MNIFVCSSNVLQSLRKQQITTYYWRVQWKISENSSAKMKRYSLYMLWSKDLNLGVTVISLNRLSEKNIKCETLLIAIA